MPCIMERRRSKLISRSQFPAHITHSHPQTRGRTDEGHVAAWQGTAAAALLASCRRPATARKISVCGWIWCQMRQKRGETRPRHLLCIPPPLQCEPEPNLDTRAFRVALALKKGPNPESTLAKAHMYELLFLIGTSERNLIKCIT